MSDDDALRIPKSGGSRKVKCKGRTCIRHPRDHKDPDMRGQPILDDDGARQYKPCEAWAANGTDYCSAHGGTTPAAINAAKRTIALATPNAAEVLRALMEDERIPAETRIKAAVQVLDRGGVRPGVDVSVDAPGWQKVLGKMFGQSTQDEPAAEPDQEMKDAVASLPPPPPAPRKRAPRKATPPPPPDNVVQMKPRKAAPKATPPKHEW